MKRLPLIFVMIVTLSMVGCKRESTVPVSKDGATEDRIEQMNREKEELTKRTEERLDEIDRQIEDLKAEAARADPDKRVRVEERIVVLEKREISLKEDLNRIKNASLEVWEDLKPKIQDALDALTRGVESAISQFKFDSNRDKYRERER